MQQTARVVESCPLHVPSTLSSCVLRADPALPSPPPPPLLLGTSFHRPLPFFCLRRMHFIQFFFLVSDGSGDSGPPVSPPRARKGEYPSPPRGNHNVTATIRRSDCSIYKNPSSRGRTFFTSSLSTAIARKCLLSLSLSRALIATSVFFFFAHVLLLELNSGVSRCCVFGRLARGRIPVLCSPES